MVAANASRVNESPQCHSFGGAALSSYQLLVGFLRTGEVLAELPCDPNYTDTLNAAGTATVTIQLDAVPTKIDLRAVTSPWRCFLAVARGRAVVWAGPIVTRRRQPGSDQVEIGATGLWSVFDRRVLARLGSWPYADEHADVLLANLTLPSIAAESLRIATNRTGGDLPLLLPASVTGNNQRSYYGFELAPAGQRLTQLVGVDGGPDCHFLPSWTPDGARIQWTTRLGTPFIGQVGSEWTFDHGAGLVDWGSDEDASTMATTALVPGDGMEHGRLIGTATDNTLVNAGWPALDLVSSDHTDVKDQATVDAYARAYLAAYRSGIELDTAVVRADADPQPGTYLVGDDAVFQPKPDRWNPSGPLRRRITQITRRSGGPDVISLTLAPVPASL
jgi:hypothetical protein